jgi:hypothetical protein
VKSSKTSGRELQVCWKTFWREARRLPLIRPPGGAAGKLKAPRFVLRDNDGIFGQLRERKRHDENRYGVTSTSGWPTS